MICQKCGKELKIGAKFCSGCGDRIPQVASFAQQENQKTETEKHCVCGNRLHPGQLFCGSCGRRIEEQKRQESKGEFQKTDNLKSTGVFNDNKERKDPIKKVIAVLGVLFLVTVISCGTAIGVFIHAHPKAKAPDKVVDSSTGEVKPADSISEHEYESSLDDANPPKYMSESTSNQEEYSGTTQSKEEATAKPDYEVVKSDASWINASQAAASKGGRLVSINNSDEFSKVCSFANSKGLKVFWVGLQRSAYDDWGDQTWNDGTSLSYAKWYPGEPSYYDEYGNDETYLMVWNVKGTWYYNDAVNDVSGYYKGKMGYIIEY